MKYYQVHCYTTLEDSSDIETVYVGASINKARKEFEKAKKQYPKVRIDGWEGEKIDGDYDGDYVEYTAYWDCELKA